ncbi:hypothetical protein N7468_005327 [Penicillium chermesinum]|uniref:MIF4G domain-containing protein n=1 Tax=Penicillium chermesinum TaxID=63820 RepID=A0A9W9TMV9_9EURO|nr:uncharacterized protein N7468_005327 [Penicillium chermesinum]KAJ5232371.1 hypothetical protein N7468_005327 [Penicillium chermesinum]
MTSIPPQSGVQQGQSTATPASTQPASTPLATTAPAAAKSYANATKKSATDPSAAPVTVGGPAQHGKSTSVSPVNGKPMQSQPTQQAGPAPTIVNGGAPTASQNDHSRKPSVTITSAGTSGFIPNGGPASRPNSLQFGFVNAQSSPNMGNPAVLASNQSQSGLGAPSMNPRVTSPQTSPSPIPQPANSGGRAPPSTYQAQGNVPNFGSFGETGDNNMRPNLQTPLAPGAQHLRRESSQSTHSDMSNHMGGPPGRGGYHHQGGRGRGYSQSGYQGQVPYSPGPSFRPTPNQPRGGHNMANAHPTTPQMHPINPAPMGQIPPQPYGYPGQHMAPQTVRTKPFLRHNHYPARRGHPKVNGTRQSQVPGLLPPAPIPQPAPAPPVLDLAPEGGQFEKYLTFVKSQQAYPPNYDPNYGYYQPQYGMPPYMTPPSPQPRPGMPFNPPGWLHARCAVSCAPSANRHSSFTAQLHLALPLLAMLTQAADLLTVQLPRSRSSLSPPKKSPIVIKDPSGNVKNFNAPASPARATPSPVKITTPSSTPPPRTASASDHSRSDSKAGGAKTDDEKKQELKNAVLKKVQEDEAAQKRQAEEAARKPAEATEPAKKDDTESARAALEGLNINEKSAPAEEPKKVEEPKKAEESKKTDEPKSTPAPAPADDDEIDFDAIEREMAEIEAKERAAEEDYYRKKQEKKEAEARKEREELEAYEANMKKAEREAEERELAKEAARAKGGDASEDEAARKERESLFSSLKSGSGYQATQSTPDDSGAATPVSSDMGPPSKPASAAAKKPTGLKVETIKSTEPTAAMKALQNAKFLEDLSKVTYPASINPPDASLNANSPPGRQFHYDRDFLLQFQTAYKDKPSADWDLRVRDTVGDADSSRPQSAVRTPSMGGRNPSRTGSGPMGSFVTRPPSVGGPVRNPFGGAGFPNPIGGRGMGNPPSRTPSGVAVVAKPPNKRDDEQNKTMPLTAGMELKAIVTTETGWKPRSLQQQSGPAPGEAGGLMDATTVQRKTKAALNKMTPENFDRISSQILEIVSQSKDESDGRTLRQVIQLTFEKATDEAHWAPMYAKFCKAMLESMSPEIKDENIRDKNGNVVCGGNLFRKYLLNRCQEEFERGWKVNLPPRPEGVTEEVAMMSDEYYIAAAAKRRGLGLVKFIGELYKLGMLTERIMHECVKKLVDFEGVPEEAEVESLTSLLRTIGASLDASEKGPAMMDAYFARIKMIIDLPELNSRMRFMLMDIVDLRKKRWQSKDSDKGPKTIQQIREEAARAQQEADMERQRQNSNRGGAGGRPPMGRGDARGLSGYGHQAPPPDYASSKVGSDDLRRLRSTRNTNQPMSFGPSSLLGSRSGSGRKGLGPGGNLVRGSDDSAASSRTGTPPAGKKEDKDASSSMNAFSALAQLEDRDNLATSPPSTHTSPVLTKSQPATEERRPSKTPSKDGENPA